jgi:hypothetical protein
MADTFTFAVYMPDPTILHTTNDEEENCTIGVEFCLGDSLSQYVVRVLETKLYFLWFGAENLLSCYLNLNNSAVLLLAALKPRCPPTRRHDVKPDVYSVNHYHFQKLKF